jgi:hypothetical protein
MNTITRLGTSIAVSLLLLAAPTAALAQAQGTSFTYQGRLTDGAIPAGGAYDFQLVLFDAPVGGSQVGPILVREDVAVAGGLFTVPLDFGAVFSGSKRWLEIGVRPGVSTDTFTTLSPRQELTPAPGALFSQAAPWAGLSGVPAGFADGTDDDTGVNAVTNGGGITGSVAGRTLTLGSDSTVQRRSVAPTCPFGQYVRSIAADGTPTCAADVDTNSGGTVTAVGTGAGLTGGPIVGSGTVAVAAGGITSGLLADAAVTSAKLADAAVTSTKIANGAVGLSQIDQSQIQARIAGLCAPEEYLRGINPDGTVVCTPLASIPPTLTTVDNPANSVGFNTSIAIGTDGLPVISYQDVSVSDLKVVKCGNPTCSAGNTITTVDTNNQAATQTSIAVPADGLPVISYRGNAPFSLRVAKCGNPACSAGNTLTPVDVPPPNVVGGGSSIKIGADGLPVISYMDQTAGALKVAKCGNPTCSAGNTITTVDDPANFVGDYTSIAIAADGRPVISYRDQTAGALKVARCGNAACSAGNTVTTVDDPAGDAGFLTSIAIGLDGLPVIAHHDVTATSLRVAKCGNPACSAGNTLTTVDEPGNVGQYPSIAVGSDGLPVISYADNNAGALKVAKCGNAACSAANTLTAVDDPPVGSVGAFTSIAIPADGLPVISYYDSSAFALKVAKCGNAACR